MSANQRRKRARELRLYRKRTIARQRWLYAQRAADRRVQAKARKAARRARAKRVVALLMALAAVRGEGT